MKKFGSLTLAALFTFGLAAVSFAQELTPAPQQPGTNTPRVDRRQANQDRRVEQGINSGQLTPKEVERLERRDASIAKQEARFKSDGTVTRRERAVLNQRLNRNSRAIARNKNDRQRQPRAH
jgi:hypothetical protein